jgi:hypothetical protein
MPSGEIIAKFDSYEEAVQHVEKLLTGDFPVRQIAIVGRGLRSVERTRGRLGYPRLALMGAVNGSVIGLIWHALTGSTDVNSYLSTVVMFAGVAALVNVVRYSLGRNKRSFTTQHQLVADSYEIQIPRDLKAQAQDAIAKFEKKQAN